MTAVPYFTPSIRTLSLFTILSQTSEEIFWLSAYVTKTDGRVENSEDPDQTPSSTLGICGLLRPVCQIHRVIIVKRLFTQFVFTTHRKTIAMVADKFNASNKVSKYTACVSHAKHEKKNPHFFVPYLLLQDVSNPINHVCLFAFVKLRIPAAV